MAAKKSQKNDTDYVPDRQQAAFDPDNNDREVEKIAAEVTEESGGELK